MEKIGRELNELLGKYETQPLKIEGHQYASKYDSTERSVVITNDGEGLCTSNPGLLTGTINGTQKHKLLKSSMNGDVYKVDLPGLSFAEKRFKSMKENGIRQLQDLEEIGYGLRNIKNVRTPKTYFASQKVLFMEYVQAPTWEEIVAKDRSMDEKLMDAFFDSGALEYITKNNIAQKDDSKLVLKKRDGSFEFVLIDPVRF